MYVVAFGNAFDGIYLYGPFETLEDAHKYANNLNEEFNIVKLNSVD